MEFFISTKAASLWNRSVVLSVIVATIVNVTNDLRYMQTCLNSQTMQDASVTVHTFIAWQIQHLWYNISLIKVSSISELHSE